MTPTDDQLVAACTAGNLARNGVGTPEDRGDRRRAAQLVSTALAADLQPSGVVASVLGVEWTEEFVAPLARWPDEDRLAVLGWLPLDRLYARLGLPGRGRWAVVHEGRVLAGVRLSVDPVRDPVAEVLARCRQRGEVRLRDVLELRALLRTGECFPAASPTLGVAADVEFGLGGRELVRWSTGRTLPAPAALPEPAVGRLVVACSGVDGSGKSSLRAALARDLARAGVPVSTVWLRPGMGLGPLATLAARLKRLLRQDPGPGIRAVADNRGSQLRSRRGIVGWTWLLAVTLAFLAGVRRQHRAAGGVVLYDRHLVDALATLEFGYQGVDLRLARGLVRAFLPRASVGFYLAVPAEVAVGRKPDDPIGEHAVRLQLAAYEREVPRQPSTLVLDGTLPPDEVAAHALRSLVRVPTGRRTWPRRLRGRRRVPAARS